MTVRAGGQSIAWTALWGFWVFVSRHNHPNLRLNAVAGALLVATFAAAVHANHLWLIPRHSRDGRFAAYATARSPPTDRDTCGESPLIQEE